MTEAIKDIKQSKSEDDIVRHLDSYLKGYSIYKKMLQLNAYETKASLFSEWNEESPGELPLARARMFEIRHRIMSLPNCDEKLMLYYHYVKGESVERCAELLGIGRSSGFRMNRRGLLMLAEKMNEENAM